MRVMARLKEPHFQMTWMPRLEPYTKYALSKTGWDKENALHAQQQGNKKSILMNVPTRQCLRKSKRDKTEPSLLEHEVSARKQRNGSIAEDTKQRWNFTSRTSSGRNICLHPRQNGRCTDVIEKFQSQNAEIFGYFYRNTNGQTHGPVWKTQSLFLSGICTVILRPGLLWERQLEKVLLK